MLDQIVGFGDAMRAAGIDVASSATIDACRALEHVELSRSGLRAALKATMVKSASHEAAFDTLFDLYFGAGPRDGPDASAPGAPTRDEVVRQIHEGLGSGSGDLAGLARLAVATFGRVHSSGRIWYSQYEVMRALDLEAFVDRMVAEASVQSSLEDRLLRDEFARLVQAFRTATLAETRRLAATVQGPAAVARYAVPPPARDLDFLSVTADLSELRRIIRPLARKLAVRVALKRRRSRRGPLDMRHTVRRSIGSGGVPFEIEHRHRPPHRPELFVLCDVSGSVARFARFGLMLTHALTTQFSRVRSFAFLESVDEVTRFFEKDDFAAAVKRLDRDARVAGDDGHSDYGTSLETFWDLYGRDVGPKATVLILGDARNNYRARKSWALRELGRRARHVYWLNPEPRRDWDTGDSLATEYAACVDDMVEVRNVRQLEEFIEKIL